MTNKTQELESLLKPDISPKNLRATYFHLQYSGIFHQKYFKR